MRIQRVLSKLNNFNRETNKKQQTQFESKNTQIFENRNPHSYTGIASVDLAYASMFDSSIAKDLKMMGLI